MYPRNICEIGEEVLSVRGLTNKTLKDISLNVRKGEILGLFGLMGAGRTNIAETIFGVGQAESGDILVNGEVQEIASPSDAMNHGIVYVSNDRKKEGLIIDQTVMQNIIMASIDKRLGKWKLDLSNEKKIAKHWIEALSIKTPRPETEVQQLSGGNQQKTVLAKCLETEPVILILNEPTRGIDVGTKVELYKLIENFCRSGLAVLMISSELPEIMGIADRIIVVHEGRVTGELVRGEYTQEKLMNFATGGS